MPGYIGNDPSTSATKIARQKEQILLLLMEARLEF